MLISLSPPQWGKVNLTGHFCGLVIKGNPCPGGTFGLISLLVASVQKHLGWGDDGYVLWCGEEFLLQPARSWML